jgi:hypothetical protein
MMTSCGEEVAPGAQLLGVWDGPPSVAKPVSPCMCPPLQVLHQVLAVTGLPRVPEEHDVWSEVQALQVLGGGWEGAHVKFSTVLAHYSWL